MTTQLETLVECPACRDRFPTAQRRRCPTCGERLDAGVEAAAPGTAAVPTDGVATLGPDRAEAAASTASALPPATPAAVEPVAMVRPLAAATATALASAAAWALLMGATGYEIGYAAWAVGGAVGAAAAVAGGRGRAVAAVSAALTVVAILVGKVAFVGYELHQAKAALRQQLQPAAYDEAVADAAALAAVAIGDNRALAAYLVDRGFAPGMRPENLRPADLALFRRTTVPMLQAMQRDRWDLGTWQEHVVDAAFADVSIAAVVGKSLGPIDLLFVLLGISTASGLVMRRTAAPTPASAA